MIFQQEQNILPEVHWGQPGGCSCAPQDLGSPPGSPLWGRGGGFYHSGHGSRGGERFGGGGGDIDNGDHGGGGDYVMQSCCGGADGGVDNDFGN